MKLIYDENLSPALVAQLADIYPGSAHVHDIGLGAADDLSVWKRAKDEGYCIVSKDSDYYDLSVLHGHPPKVIWPTEHRSPTRFRCRETRASCEFRQSDERMSGHQSSVALPSMRVWPDLQTPRMRYSPMVSTEQSKPEVTR